MTEFRSASLMAESGYGWLSLRYKPSKVADSGLQSLRNAGRTHEPHAVQDVENLYAGIFLKNRLRYRVAQN